MPSRSTVSDRLLHRTALLLVLGACASSLHAQPAASGPGIYTCVDGRGRTITADRPIPDCADREQRELNPGGGVRRRIEPTYTAREQAEREEKARQEELVKLRQVEERRRERALVARYPNPASHDRERAEALVQIDAVIQAARKRITELMADRRKIDDEMEFYTRDPSKAPDALRRRLDDNQKSVAVQNRFITEQEDEKKRVHARFDEERSRLTPLWTASGVPLGGGGTGSGTGTGTR